MDNRNETTLPKGGLYHLILHMDQNLCFEIGALGKRSFPAGTYIYTGSAKRGLSPRIKRHLKKEKNCRWHIDYLTSLVSVDTVLVDASGLKSECQRYQMVSELPWAEVIVPGFGSSDCPCVTHLTYFADCPPMNRLMDTALIAIPVSDLLYREGEQKNEARDDYLTD